MNAWQIFVVFAAGVGCGIALGWLCGHSLGFYFGRRVERKRLAKLLAGKTALEVVTELMKTGKLIPTDRKKAGPIVTGTPRDETRH